MKIKAVSSEHVPVVGCWVTTESIDDFGRVHSIDEVAETGAVVVNWIKQRRRQAVLVNELIPRFENGMDVQDKPRSFTRPSLGEGVVVATRKIGLRHQVLVEFHESGQRVWLPWQNIKGIKGVRLRFVRGDIGSEGNSERFRLRSLAHAINRWNQNTGSLSRMNIDPLPHQIHLVHHILASGNLNWLIADDVGLGKTIEVGMLISALVARKQARRILLITPSGLVHQWQEELNNRFGLSDFQIYGKDFSINNVRHWKQYDRVIGSIDRLKSESHLQSLLQAEPWDLVVFDEAHRLGRRQYGRSYKASGRFSLAADLRKRTDAMLLLSATPHQGMQDKFQGLLELLRPDNKAEITTLSENPELIREMVYRNRKADVANLDGDLIFKDKISRRIEVPVSLADREFDKALQKYFREGYSEHARRGSGRSAIGFVMSSYRKLAASSIAAILDALERRLVRIDEKCRLAVTEAAEDERYSGELIEHNLNREDRQHEFFIGEREMVGELIRQAKSLRVSDTKMTSFMQLVKGEILARNSKEKIVIFTEYRATQNYLEAELRKHFGEESVVTINGGHTFTEREESIQKLDTSSQFLISTEAGGEGLNMHSNCHIMINYDLPWNPMRLVQRIGRLYRYGQTKKVVVLNMNSPQTVDARVMSVMYERLSQVVRDLAPLSAEFEDGLQDEIMGELASVLDVSDILESVVHEGEERCQARIDEALASARDAVNLQRELFDYAQGFDPTEMTGQIKIGTEHVEKFIRGMCAIKQIECSPIRGKPGVFSLMLDEETKLVANVRRKEYRVAFDRSAASSHSDVHMIDMNSQLLGTFLDEARTFDFGGHCAGIRNLNGKAVITATLRWQNDQGQRMREEFTALVADENGKVDVNPDEFSEWLKTEAVDSSGEVDTSRKLISDFEECMNIRLSEVANRDLHPENCQLLSAGLVEKRL